jgi:hypothetical protein
MKYLLLICSMFLNPCLASANSGVSSNIVKGAVLWEYEERRDLGPQIENTKVEVVAEYIWPGINIPAYVDSGGAKQVIKTEKGYKVTREIPITAEGMYETELRLPGRSLKTVYYWTIPKLGAYNPAGQTILEAGDSLDIALTSVSREFKLYGVDGDRNKIEGLRLLKVSDSVWKVQGKILNYATNRVEKTIIKLQQKWPELKEYELELEISEVCPITIKGFSKGWRYLTNEGRLEMEVEISQWERPIEDLVVVTDSNIAGNVKTAYKQGKVWRTTYVFDIKEGKPLYIEFKTKGGVSVGKQNLLVF